MGKTVWIFNTESLRHSPNQVIKKCSEQDWFLGKGYIGARGLRGLLRDVSESGLYYKGCFHPREDFQEGDFCRQPPQWGEIYAFRSHLQDIGFEEEHIVSLENNYRSSVLNLPSQILQYGIKKSQAESGYFLRPEKKEIRFETHPQTKDLVQEVSFRFFLGNQGGEAIVQETKPITIQVLYSVLSPENTGVKLTEIRVPNFYVPLFFSDQSIELDKLYQVFLKTVLVTQERGKAAFYGLGAGESVSFIRTKLSEIHLISLNEERLQAPPSLKKRIIALASSFSKKRLYFSDDVDSDFLDHALILEKEKLTTQEKIEHFMKALDRFIRTLPDRSRFRIGYEEEEKNYWIRYIYVIYNRLYLDAVKASKGDVSFEMRIKLEPFSRCVVSKSIYSKQERTLCLPSLKRLNDHVMKAIRSSLEREEIREDYNHFKKLIQLLGRPDKLRFERYEAPIDKSSSKPVRVYKRDCIYYIDGHYLYLSPSNNKYFLALDPNAPKENKTKIMVLDQQAEINDNPPVINLSPKQVVFADGDLSDLKKQEKCNNDSYYGLLNQETETWDYCYLNGRGKVYSIVPNFKLNSSMIMKLGKKTQLNSQTTYKKKENGKVTYLYVDETGKQVILPPQVDKKVKNNETFLDESKYRLLQGIFNLNFQDFKKKHAGNERRLFPYEKKIYLIDRLIKNKWKEKIDSLYQLLLDLETFFNHCKVPQHNEKKHSENIRKFEGMIAEFAALKNSEVDQIESSVWIDFLKKVYETTAFLKKVFPLLSKTESINSDNGSVSNRENILRFKKAFNALLIEMDSLSGRELFSLCFQRIIGNSVQSKPNKKQSVKEEIKSNQGRLEHGRQESKNFELHEWFRKDPRLFLFFLPFSFIKSEGVWCKHYELVRGVYPEVDEFDTLFREYLQKRENIRKNREFVFSELIEKINSLIVLVRSFLNNQRLYLLYTVFSFLKEELEKECAHLNELEAIRLEYPEDNKNDKTALSQILEELGLFDKENDQRFPPKAIGDRKVTEKMLYVRKIISAIEKNPNKKDWKYHPKNFTQASRYANTVKILDKLIEEVEKKAKGLIDFHNRDIQKLSRRDFYYCQLTIEMISVFRKKHKNDQQEGYFEDIEDFTGIVHLFLDLLNLSLKERFFWENSKFYLSINLLFKPPFNFPLPPGFKTDRRGKIPNPFPSSRFSSLDLTLQYSRVEKRVWNRYRKKRWFFLPDKRLTRKRSISYIKFPDRLDALTEMLFHEASHKAISATSLNQLDSIEQYYASFFIESIHSDSIRRHEDFALLREAYEKNPKNRAAGYARISLMFQLERLRREAAKSMEEINEIKEINEKKEQLKKEASTLLENKMKFLKKNKVNIYRVKPILETMKEQFLGKLEEMVHRKEESIKYEQLELWKDFLSSNKTPNPSVQRAYHNQELQLFETITSAVETVDKKSQWIAGWSSWAEEEIKKLSKARAAKATNAMDIWKAEMDSWKARIRVFREFCSLSKKEESIAQDKEVYSWYLHFCFNDLVRILFRDALKESQEDSRPWTDREGVIYGETGLLSFLRTWADTMMKKNYDDYPQAARRVYKFLDAYRLQQSQYIRSILTSQERPNPRPQKILDLIRSELHNFCEQLSGLKRGRWCEEQLAALSQRSLASSETGGLVGKMLNCIRFFYRKEVNPNKEESVLGGCLNSKNLSTIQEESEEMGNGF